MRYQRMISKDKTAITRVYGCGKVGEVVANSSVATVKVENSDSDKKVAKSSVKK